jgi:hypothetical protein
MSREAVPKIVTLSRTICTSFPVLQTSLGEVLLSAHGPKVLREVLAIPSRSGANPKWHPDESEIVEVLRGVRAQGWALTEEQLAPGIRFVATEILDGDGNVVAAKNSIAHSAETSLDDLQNVHLPLLLQTARSISARWGCIIPARCSRSAHARPLSVVLRTLLLIGRFSVPAVATVRQSDSGPQEVNVAEKPPIDSTTVPWLASGNIEAILEIVTAESMSGVGNATHLLLYLILMMGIAGSGKAAYVDELDLFHTRELYMTWSPGSDPR